MFPDSKITIVTAADAEPPDAEPPEAKPPEAKPPEAKPADAEPPEAKPADAEPADAEPPEAKPADAEPADAKPADAEPPEANSTDGKLLKEEAPKAAGCDEPSGLYKTPSILEGWTHALDLMAAKGCSEYEAFEQLSKDGYTAAIYPIKHYFEGKAQREEEAKERKAAEKERLAKEKKEAKERKAAEKKQQKEAEKNLKRVSLHNILYMGNEEAESIMAASALNIDAAGQAAILELVGLSNSLQSIVMGKKPSLLEGWMQRASLLGAGEIDSYVNGMSIDFEAVSNAVKSDRSNSLSEGSVNKLKVFKRVMYGRGKIGLLEAKLMVSQERKLELAQARLAQKAMGMQRAGWAALHIF